MGIHSDLFAEFPILNTNRLILRQMIIDDAEDFFQYYSDHEITQFLDWHGPASIEQTFRLRLASIFPKNIGAKAT